VFVELDRRLPVPAVIIVVKGAKALKEIGGGFRKCVQLLRLSNAASAVALRNDKHQQNKTDNQTEQHESGAHWHRRNFGWPPTKGKTRRSSESRENPPYTEHKAQ